MNLITQPATVTDLRRDPKGLMERVKKEGVIPILTHSEFEVAMISIEKLNELYEAIKNLKHELFVQETLEAVKDYEQHGGGGPFDSVEEFMEHLNHQSEADVKN